LTFIASYYIIKVNLGDIMNHYRIEVGESDINSCIGIKPPIGEEVEREQILIALGEDLANNALSRGGFNSVKPFNESEYTEVRLDTSRLASNSTNIKEVAGKIAEALRSTSSEVTVDLDINPIDSGRYLFRDEVEKSRFRRT
jgi:hypothetical protein